MSAEKIFQSESWVFLFVFVVLFGFLVECWALFGSGLACA